MGLANAECYIESDINSFFIYVKKTLSNVECFNAPLLFFFFF